MIIKWGQDCMYEISCTTTWKMRKIWIKCKFLPYVPSLEIAYIQSCPHFIIMIVMMMMIMMVMMMVMRLTDNGDDNNDDDDVDVDVDGDDLHSPQLSSHAHAFPNPHLVDALL